MTLTIFILFCLYLSETNKKADEPGKKGKGEIVKINSLSNTHKEKLYYL